MRPRFVAFPLLAAVVLGCSFGPMPFFHNRLANPTPTVSIEPVNPCAGDQVQVHGSNAPANTAIELWLMPRLAGGFKAGVYSPRDAGGVQLGTATTDVSGVFSFTFTFQRPASDQNIVPAGYYQLWLVYPPGDVIAPNSANWQCPPPTTVKGNVYDATGKPLSAGSVDVKVSSDSGTVIYDRTVPVVDGAYELDDVPEPATTDITVTVPDWPERTRHATIGAIQVKWAGNPSGPIAGDTFVRTQGNPLTYNFGGPATPDDPDAPAYFLSPNAANPDMAYASLSGKVYDENDDLVPDREGAIVIVDAQSGQSFHATAKVTGGAYRIDQVPTGVPMTVDLRINPVYVLVRARTKILIAPDVSGKPNVVNFGGPAPPEDPDAPNHPFPSPSPLLSGPSPFTPP